MKCLYLIGWNKNGPLKIGTTLDPRKRLTAMQTSQPEKLGLFGVFRCPIAQTEKQIHAALKHTRLAGEWFQVSVDDAIEAIRTVFARENLEFAAWTDADLESVTLGRPKVENPKATVYRFRVSYEEQQQLIWGAMRADMSQSRWARETLLAAAAASAAAEAANRAASDPPPVSQSSPAPGLRRTS